MGDWMGNNADRWIASVKYTPIPKLKCMLRYQVLRKGSNGTIDQQYFQEPQPPFLFGLLTKQQEWHFQCSYEWLNKLSFTGYYQSAHINDIVNSTSKQDNSFSLGIRYGL
jgi:predicted porin